ncbi:MAG: hypothetical protein ACOCZP_03055 [Candidatus Hadarchaeota archaeon]
MRCKECGNDVEYLTDELCNDCFIKNNEGPCGCFTKLKRFE